MSQPEFPRVGCSVESILTQVCILITLSLLASNGNFRAEEPPNVSLFIFEVTDAV